jgi:arylsulfatase A-like enzyme
MNAQRRLLFRSMRRLGVAAALVCGAALSGPAAPQPASRPPRLAVVIVIDQFRADYLTRFRDWFLPALLPERKAGGSSSRPGGFRFLMERGAYFESAYYDHYPLFTGPGHAIVLTGAPPCVSGVVGNEWFDRITGQEVYCAADSRFATIGASPQGKNIGTAPTRMRANTVGDELKLATRDRARVVALSLKDRAAIFLGGHLADRVVWYDKGIGGWVTSAFYARDGQVPAWAREVNASGYIDSLFGKQWTPLESGPRVASARAPGVPERSMVKLGPGFPHRITGGVEKPGPKFYDAVTLTPFGNELTLRTARAAITAERLGTDDVPDLLGINLSSNDYIGHAYGPDSPEVADMTVRTDRQLSEFFQFLDQAVPGGLEQIAIVVTSDHGMAPIPEEMQARGLDAGRIPLTVLEKAAQEALAARYGAGDWIVGMIEPTLYLNQKTLADRGIAAGVAESVAARALEAVPGVFAAYTRTQVLEGRLPNDSLSRAVTAGFHRTVSGDVVVVPRPYWFLDNGEHVTTHGSPYAYDTHVPLLLWGPGVRAGRYRERVSMFDLAPTLAMLLHVPVPNACQGAPLSAALQEGGTRRAAVTARAAPARRPAGRGMADRSLVGRRP